jgi:hypothetical protein
MFLNKEKRSIALAMILGDGCLHLTSNKASGAITIDHGLDQVDYLTWKASLLSDIFNRNVRVRSGHRGKSVQVSIADRRLRSWRKFCYPGGKKSLIKTLRLIHTELDKTLAIWLMDDGYVESSFTKNKNYSASLRLFTCSEPFEGQELIVDWFKSKFNVSPKIKTLTKKSTGKTYLFLKINSGDSLIIWERIRETVLQFKSMQYKFRYLEEIYQKRLPQRTPSVHKTEDDIVGALGKPRE